MDLGLTSHRIFANVVVHRRISHRICNRVPLFNVSYALFCHAPHVAFNMPIDPGVGSQ